MKRILVCCLVLLVLVGMTSSIKAKDTGGITLDFTQLNGQMKIANQLEQPSYGITTMAPVKAHGFTSMDIRIVKVEDGVESTCWESNVIILENISIALDPGTYKIYTQLEGDDTVLEYNNDSEGYVITPQDHLVIPMAYPPWDGYILDVPWRIENSEMIIPILAVDNDWLTYADINNIYVYDHNNGDSLVTSTNWDSQQLIDSSNTPFFYLFNIDKNLFVQVDSEVSIKIKFDLHLWFDNWEGPLNAKISPDNIPKVTNWYCGDTHLHTNYTSNVVEYGAPIYATRAANNAMGLDWMTVTDHSFDLDPDKWSASSADCNAHSDNLFRIIQGEEVSCYLPGTDITPGQYQYNHLLVYGADFIPGGEWEDGTDSYYTPAEVLSIANSQGGVTYPAHPLDDDQFRDPWQDYSLNFNGLQIWNYGSPDNIGKLESGIEIWKELLLEGRHVYTEGGTDAHGDFNTHAGKVKTFVHIPGYSQNSLPSENNILEALRNGHSIMTDGPLVIFNITNEHGETAIIGDEIAGNNLTLNIQWESTSEFGNVGHIYVHRGIIGENEEEIYHLTPNSLSGTHTYSDLASKIPESKTAYIRIHATNPWYTDEWGNFQEGNRAYTNPIWITRMKILFDDTHDTDSDELTGNYQKLKTSLEDAGYTIDELDVGPITSDILKNYAILILPDVELELSISEVEAMTDFLNNGGRILIVGEWKGAHLPLSVSKISEVMGIEFQETILNDTTNFYESTQWPIIHNIDTSHPIGNGILSFAMYAGSSLGFTSDTPKAIARGDDDTTAEDPVGDGSAPDNEFTPQVQKEVIATAFPQGVDIIVLASSKFPVSGGEARLVCIGDSDLWKTITEWEWTDYDPIENYDNKKLLLNVINWLATPAPPQEPTTNFGTVSQGEMSTFTISVLEAVKQLNIALTLPGSDLDLHLYDPEGRHVGYNYTTDQEEIEIPGATYSGRTAKPEWINVTLSSQSGEWTVGVYGYQVEGVYEFYKVESLTDVTPPAISNVHHLPSPPTDQDAVNVFADVIDDVAVQSVTCHWTIDFVNWTTVTMSKKSSTYKTDSPIPSHSTGTTVYYYIKATDTSGHETTDPMDVPISTHSYSVTAIALAQVPTLTPIGLTALAGLLLVTAISTIRRKR